MPCPLTLKYFAWSAINSNMTIWSKRMNRDLPADNSGLESWWGNILFQFLYLLPITSKLSLTIIFKLYLNILYRIGSNMLNATFNNISVIWVSVSFIGGVNRSTLRKSPPCRKSLTNLITQCCIKYTSPWRESNSQL